MRSRRSRTLTAYVSGSAISWTPCSAPSRARPDRLKHIYQVAVVLAVTPIVVSALRNGLSGWVPTGDAAITTLRIKDVFTAHPPLVGMAALTSTGTSHPYSFPARSSSTCWPSP